MQWQRASEISLAEESLNLFAPLSDHTDPFCSTGLWQISAHEAFNPDRALWGNVGETGALVFALQEQNSGMTVLEPLEPMWLLGCPLVGPEPGLLMEELEEALGKETGWDALILSGLRVSETILRALAQLHRRYRVCLGPATGRCVASLEGGLDGFLARRSGNLRKALRRCARKARDLGIEFEPAVASDVRELELMMDRIFRVESESWKGLGGVGVDQGEMRTFYSVMLPRLLEADGLKLTFALWEGKDIGFILGGVLGDTYRGLQFSFHQGYNELGLGNLLQLQHILELSEQGISYYDLGTDMAYKRRWAERVMETMTFVLYKNS
ncbi:MAG: GNAT family N-acetyltransferase [Myxococcota bacterium]|nr:GNAT family N-acetyltransferase [Myxococcota bacterium]